MRQTKPQWAQDGGVNGHEHKAGAVQRRRHHRRDPANETGIVKMVTRSRTRVRHCVLRNVSDEGVRLLIRGSADDTDGAGQIPDARTPTETERSRLSPGSTFVLSFAVGGRRLELPCSVAWMTQREDGIEVGARLRLEIAGTDMRRDYGVWLQTIPVGVDS